MKAKGQKSRTHAKCACRICPPLDGENVGLRRHKKILRRRDRHVEKQSWSKEVKGGKEDK
jgi:hypothetical protein